jgi:CBS domain-containing protein
VAKIRDVMNQQVAALPCDATVREAVEFLTRQHTGGAPVLGDDGRVVGVVSELSLIDVVFDPAVRDAPISNFMTPEVHTVHPDAPLTQAAQLFALYSFRRLPVVEDGNLVGIISRRDLMNYALRTEQVLSDPLLELIPALAPVS